MAEIIKEAKNKVEWVSEEERPVYGEQSQYNTVRRLTLR